MLNEKHICTHLRVWCCWYCSTSKSHFNKFSDSSLPVFGGYWVQSILNIFTIMSSLSGFLQCTSFYLLCTHTYIYIYSLTIWYHPQSNSKHLIWFVFGISGSVKMETLYYRNILNIHGEFNNPSDGGWVCISVCVYSLYVLCVQPLMRSSIFMQFPQCCHTDQTFSVWIWKGLLVMFCALIKKQQIKDRHIRGIHEML